MSISQDTNRLEWYSLVFIREFNAGYTLIKVLSRAGAIAWSQRFLNPAGEGDTEIEVRPLLELDDFEPGEAIERFRELESSRGN